MKNIILLISDTYRYDNLFDRAERQVRTPELDRFATTRATEVTGFYAGSFPTIPHRTDLTTGRLGWPHYGWQALEKSSPNHLPAMLGEQGYETQLICDCPHLFGAGFNSGFHAAYHNRGQEGDVHWLHLNDPIQNVMPHEKTRIDCSPPLVDQHRWTNRYFTTEPETFPARTGSLLVQWIEENYKSEAPFFLWADLFVPHEPWDAPESMVRHYDPDYNGTPMLHPNYGRSDVYTKEELQNLWAHYAAEAELVDRWVGRVLQKIEDTGLFENSIVLFTSDHGCSVGDHERTGKTNISGGKDDRYWPLYPEVGHVPFLVAGGGVPAGTTLDVLAQPIDILPTLCELAGVTVEPKQPVEGKSFADKILAGAGTHREFAVTASPVSNPANPPPGATTPFVTTDRWGYAPIGSQGEPELFDLRDDPFAKNDVAAANPDAVRDLHALLVRHLQEHRADAAIVDAWTERSAG